MLSIIFACYVVLKSLNTGQLKCPDYFVRVPRSSFCLKFFVFLELSFLCIMLCRSTDAVACMTSCSSRASVFSLFFCMLGGLSCFFIVFFLISIKAM
jgi:hypothetical protein